MISHRAGSQAMVVLMAATALAPGSVSSGFEIPLDRPAMTRAVKLARWPATAAERAAFHSRYLFDLPDESIAPIRIDRIEVTTEFRRLVLLAEYHAQLNDLWGGPGTRDAEEALKPWRGAVWITAHGSYRDLTHLSPRPEEIAIRIEGPASPVRGFTRTFEGGNCDGCQITGAMIEAAFDAAPLAHAVRPVVVDWNGVTLARLTIDFNSLE